MAKIKAVLLIKTTPSSYSSSVLTFQENLLNDYLKETNVSICGVYRFIGDRFVTDSYEFKQLVQCIRTSRVQKIFVVSKDIISCNLNEIIEFEWFCRFHHVSLEEIPMLYQMIKE